MQLIWHKRDLRTVDHVPLQRALEQSGDSELLPLYIHEPGWLAQPYVSGSHQQFVHESLDDLRLAYRAAGGDLAETTGDAVAIFARLHAQAPITAIWAYQEVTTLWGYERDQTVRRWCKQQGIALHELPQNGVHRGRDGYLKYNFKAYLDDSAYTPLTSLKKIHAANPAIQHRWAFTPGSPLELGNPPHQRPALKSPPAPQAMKGGMRQAHALIATFFQEKNLFRYPGSLSNPSLAEHGCSRLSPYLAYGVVSDRFVLQRLNTVYEAALPGLDRISQDKITGCAKFFADRMHWRSMYAQAMEVHPHSEVQCDIAGFNGLREHSETTGWFEAWAGGQTGVPMVDAAMRQLNHTGWIPMRMRGMVTSFALNELWLPWQQVAHHLACAFVDFEPFIHFSQVQIHAGSSRLSGPLIYDPVKQQAEQDEQGDYVQRWVPEHLSPTYPAPLVNIHAARERARKRVFAIRKGQPDPGNSLTPLV
ncbi:deoxyribodipyrimidine photo-lyase [Limnobacter humi]|uniref:Deoxyribodipyrimidine photo-lyase n=1 Tax=Limnobacter humi TaxID=1778671 RepID=A0ABT1WBW5_9BURK|nr:FAD-binding domain-containing protein [Limnobacter humi]MCQ8895006.1 deoxyribodipyrimidine photo-lyase [Limnobacter humi]